MDYFPRSQIALVNAIRGQVALAEDISHLRSLIRHPFIPQGYALRYKYYAPMELIADKSARCE
jgi:hypothetical protein